MTADDRFNLRTPGRLSVDAVVSRSFLPSTGEKVLLRFRATESNRCLRVQCSDKEALTIAYQIVGMCEDPNERIAELVSRTRRAVRLAEVLRTAKATREQVLELSEDNWGRVVLAAFPEEMNKPKPYQPSEKTRAMVLEMI